MRKTIATLGLAAAVTALTLLTAGTADAQTTPPPASAYDAGIAAAIHSDDASSTELPDGENLWVFGDTTEVDGVSTVSGYGYPHDAFALQEPGSTTFQVLPGPYGYGWQQVPNWSNGDYFWPSGLTVDGPTLYVFGEQVSGISVVTDAVAQFSAATLTYQSITLLPTAEDWGGILWGQGGFWMPGTSNVSCTGATDCKTGVLAWVPTGDETDYTAWAVTPGVFPPALNTGTVISPVQTTTGYAVFTKEGDEYGSNSIEELTSASMTGPWTVSQIIPAPCPPGTLTYGVEVHQNEPVSASQVLLTYAVNGKAQYWPDFVYVTP